MLFGHSSLNPERKTEIPEEEIRRRISDAAKKELEVRNVKRVKMVEYEKGMKCFLKNRNQKKIDYVWKGPFEIAEVSLHKRR